MFGVRGSSHGVGIGALGFLHSGPHPCLVQLCAPLGPVLVREPATHPTQLPVLTGHPWEPIQGARYKAGSHQAEPEAGVWAQSFQDISDRS